ncbi:thiamine pyrophosphate-binding protein [Kribbella catacumbae]|uniref:thiamine pyrophosphate-binding protein n=1 Tax=Kribbella catacumbae TaxID=460086 RepID=UPI0003725022|nr:thiamine pyrophosphate-binding protein [Kribbella catacumbae]
MPSGGEVLVAALAARGVDTVFGIPGTHNLAVYAALAAHGIRHISPRHEQGAGYAADGYARSAGRPGVVLTTTGPGILNAAAAAAQAYSDSVPVLFISPGMPLWHPVLGNGFLHEVKNQSAAMDAIVEYSHRVTSVEEIPLAVARAFAVMTSGRPRPVHLEIPLDLLEEEARAPLLPDAPGAPTASTAYGSPLAATALAAAATPVLIVGGGAHQATDQLVAFADALGAPVFTTANGKGAFPTDHPLHAGAGVHHPAVQAAVGEADLVVAVGTELAPSDWWFGLPELTGKLVRIDIDPISMHRNAPATHALVGDCRRVLDDLLAHLGDSSADGTARAAVLRTRHQADARAEGEPWLEMLAAIEAALPPEAIVAADNAMVSYYGALSNLPRRFLYPTGAGTLGYGLPAGIGAKVANPELPVLVLQGDGGIMFTIAELATAAELRLPLPIVVVDNGGYGEIRNEMADRGDPVHAVALGHPDFVALGKSLGCRGVLVGAAELAGAIETALTSDRPTVIHILESSRAAKALL